MNGKVITLIVGLIVLVGIVGAFFMLGGKENEDLDNTQLENSVNSNDDEIDETKNETDADETIVNTDTDDTSNNDEKTDVNTNTNATVNNTSNNTNNEKVEDEEKTDNTVVETNVNVPNTNVNNEVVGDKTDEKRALVLYFSMSGNTETIANFIHDRVGGDIIKLETVSTYPNEYNELLDYAQQEQRNNARPELKTTVDVSNYDVIFLGYPNWWADMPMPIYTFLDTYDLSGKTIAPFITHGGSGLSGTPGKIKTEEPNATVTEGLAVNGSRVSNSQSTVNDWIAKIGF